MPSFLVKGGIALCHRIYLGAYCISYYLSSPPDPPSTGNDKGKGVDRDPPRKFYPDTPEEIKEFPDMP